MSCRLVVITEIIAPYRVPVFNVLAVHPEIDLHVIFLAETDPTQRQWLVPTEEIHFSYQVLPNWRRRIHDHNLLLNWGLEAALRQTSPDVIICGGYNYLASWLTLHWAQRNRVPLLLWTESTGLDRRSESVLLESLKARFIKDCAGFVVPGKASFDYLTNFGINSQHIFIAPNAVDNEFFSQASRTARENIEVTREKMRLPVRYFLFAGRLVRAKGIFDLVEAYGALPQTVRSEVGLVFVGDGPDRGSLEELAARVHPGSIHVAGFAQRDTLAAYYALADAFVLPTHTDPWGLVVNEAMACGLPIICSDVAGCASDLVAGNHNGRTFPAGDVQRLTAALLEIASDQELRASLVRNSETKIRQYSPEKCAAGMVSAALACAEVRHA